MFFLFFTIIFNNLSNKIGLKLKVCVIGVVADVDTDTGGFGSAKPTLSSLNWTT